MTTEEFSDEFDVLVDSYRRFKDFDRKENLDSIECNEYEKSIFLTQAQEEILISLYNQVGEGFESSEEIRRYLASLLKKEKITGTGNIFILPDDVWFITYETAEVGNKELLVVPTKQDELYSTKENPFRRADKKRRVLRLDMADNKSELIADGTVTSYNIRYITKPSPIVLIDLPNNLKIEGVGTKTECRVHSALHKKILTRAVQLAFASKAIATDK